MRGLWIQRRSRSRPREVWKSLLCYYGSELENKGKRSNDFRTRGAGCTHEADRNVHRVRYVQGANLHGVTSIPCS